MLSYPLAEASALLAEKLVAAQLGLKNLIEDVEFLKEQITIMEVNTARVYNFDVKRLVFLGHLSEGFVWREEEGGNERRNTREFHERTNEVRRERTRTGELTLHILLSVIRCGKRKKAS